jgi:hypothetical protein
MYMVLNLALIKTPKFCIEIPPKIAKIGLIDELTFHSFFVEI